MNRAREKKTKPGSVRIIGGTWRRRRIAIATGSELRPTPDRVRETLFNWLQPKLSGARCLDLYAGTGVLGFEALSRGATSAVLVERDTRAAEALERQRDELGANASIVCADAGSYLARPDVGKFDVLFVDPPYQMDAAPALESVLALLAPGARIYLERARGQRWPEIAQLEWIRRSAAGAVDFGLAEAIG